MFCFLWLLIHFSYLQVQIPCHLQGTAAVSVGNSGEVRNKTILNASHLDFFSVERRKD